MRVKGTLSSCIRGPSELSRSSGSAPGPRDAPRSPSDAPFPLADPKPSSWCTTLGVSRVPTVR